MQDYQEETLKMIRSRPSKLKWVDDEKLIRLYQEWSENTACAGWLTPCDRSIREFIIWAITPPCDRER